MLDDLGSQGEWPTHPELLDWLAAEFVHPVYQAQGAHAWDVKHLIRTIVTSQTYRQSSMSTPELDERDPDNRLLARQSRFRVDAEVVRDIALSVSGLLVEKFGGPSAKPYEPDGYLATLNFPKREYAASHGDDLYRRGVYTFWQRTFLHPSLLTFDAPTREECTVNRVNSNTPLQALVLLNDPIYVEAARVFAQNILQHGRDWNARIDWAFERAAGRTPVAEERSALTQAVRQNLAQFQRSPADARALTHEGEAPVAESAGRRTGRHDHGGARHSQHARNHHQELRPSMNWNRTQALSTFTAAPSCGYGIAGLGLLGLNSLMADQQGVARRDQPAASSRPRPSASSFSTRPAARRTWRPSTTSRSSPRCTAKACRRSFTKGQQIAQLQGKPLICFGPQHGFKKFGKNGQEICELFPHIGSVADDVCIIRSMWTEQINHDPAHTIMNTGSIIAGRPSMGSWVLYGLGAETRGSAGLRGAALRGQGRADAADRGAPVVGGTPAQQVSRASS